MLISIMFVLFIYYCYICEQNVNKMNSRLQQFLGAENISQSQFADSIGVARASVSHILAGRNRPGFDFIESMARHYPTLNLEWLITGKGRMYKAISGQADSPAVTSANTVEESLFPAAEEQNPLPIIESNTVGRATQRTVKQSSISKIVVFYDDNSYEELR